MTDAPLMGTTIALVAVIAAVVVVLNVVDSRRLRHRSPALVREAAALGGAEIHALDDKQLNAYLEAAWYVARFRSGALAQDPELSALRSRLGAESSRRREKEAAAQLEREQCRKAADAARAKRDLGL